MYENKSSPTAHEVVGDPQLLNRVAWSVRWQDRRKSIAYAEAAAELAQRAIAGKADPSLGRAHLTLGWQAKWRGAFDASMDHILTVERYLSEAKYPSERAYAYGILGVLHYSRGRLDLATDAVDRGLTLVDSATDVASFVELLASRASVLRFRGDKTRAGLVLGRAEDVAEGCDIPRIQQNIARWLLSDRAFAEAAERAQRSVDLARDHECKVIEPYAQEVLGSALANLGQYDEAKAAFSAGLEVARADEDARAQCQILCAHGEMEVARGDTDEALALCRSGEKIACKLGYTPWQQRFAREIAGIHEMRGDLAAALHEHRVAWAIADKKRT